MGEVGTGTYIRFQNGFLGEILSVKGPDAERKSIDMTHMLSVAAMEFTPGDLVNWGEVSIDIAFDPSTLPPIDQPPETVTITFPDSASTEWEFRAFMTRFSPSTPLEERMTASAVLKVSGVVIATP